MTASNPWPPSTPKPGRPGDTSGTSPAPAWIALRCPQLAIAEAQRLLDLQDLPTDRGADRGDDPLLPHLRTRVKSPPTNGVIKRFIGTLKYQHLYRGHIGDGDTIRPHQALHDNTPKQAHLDKQNLPDS